MCQTMCGWNISGRHLPDYQHSGDYRDKEKPEVYVEARGKVTGKLGNCALRGRFVRETDGKKYYEGDDE